MRLVLIAYRYNLPFRPLFLSTTSGRPVSNTCRPATRRICHYIQRRCLYRLGPPATILLPLRTAPLTSFLVSRFRPPPP